MDGFCLQGELDLTLFYKIEGYFDNLKSLMTLMTVTLMTGFMNTLHSCLAYYLLAINAVAFIVYGIDKYKAKKAKWRIPEATLLLLAVVGGSVGAWIGMKVWHHKTMHKKFKYGIPAILLIQIALMAYLHIK